MITVDALSERIVDETFLHSDLPDDEDAIAHYGVLGMKWGVRKDRKREDETDQQYKDRMDRESRERTAKADRKARAKEQKRALKSQERIEKTRSKTQLKQTQKQIDAQAKQRKDQQKQQEKQQARQDKERRKNETKNSVLKKHQPEPTMSDKDLSDAINRLRNEKAFKELKKKPDGLGKTILKTAVVGILVPVGTKVVKDQLESLGGDYLEKQGSKVRKKFDIPKTVKKGASQEWVKDYVDEKLKGR